MERHRFLEEHAALGTYNRLARGTSTQKREKRRSSSGSDSCRPPCVISALHWGQL